MFIETESSLSSSSDCCLSIAHYDSMQNNPRSHRALISFPEIDVIACNLD